MASKLKALKLDLKKCYQEVFGHVRKRKQKFMEELGEMDTIAEGLNCL